MALDLGQPKAKPTDLEQPKAKSTVAYPRPRGRRLGAAHVVILLLALVASAAAGYLGYQRFSPQKAVAAATATTPVSRGSITATVSTVGSTVATFQAKLAFESAGRLLALPVKVGDSVKAGDALARLDSADLTLQVAQAEVALEQAKVQLAQLKEGPKAVEVAAARASYESALTKYNDVKASPKSEDVAEAAATVRDAEVALANARDSLILTQKGATVSKNVRDREFEHNYYEANVGETVAKMKRGEASQADVDRDYANLLTAKEKLDSARAEAELALRKAENDVVKAETTLRNAQDSLAKLKAGPTPEELKSAEAAMLTAQSQFETKTAGTAASDISAQEVAVRLAEATLKQKQLLLEKATLRAPFDGVVDTISLNVGEQAGAATEVMSLVNMRQFRINARVDESDVARLAVGQSASVTLDALPQERLSARVASIGANATIQSGVATYLVVLDIDPTEAPVRPGMTTNVVLEVARRDNVLLVPNRAIRSQGRSRVVEVIVDGKRETRTVSVGMSNDQSTEVTDGLREGDLVVIPATTTAAPRVPQTGAIGGMPGMGVPPGGFGR